GEHAYVPLGEAAVADALKQAGVSAASVKAWIVTGPHSRASRRVASAVGAAKGTVADDLAASLGNTGTAHAGLMLAHALDRAHRPAPRDPGGVVPGAPAARGLAGHALPHAGPDPPPAPRRSGCRAAPRGRPRPLRDVPDRARLPAARAAAPA